MRARTSRHRDGLGTNRGHGLGLLGLVAAVDDLWLDGSLGQGDNLGVVVLNCLGFGNGLCAASVSDILALDLIMNIQLVRNR